MNQKISTKALSGFMELLPEEQVVFEEIKDKILEVYKSYGFFPLDTPMIERNEVLFSKTAGETQKQIYRLEKEDLSLRFDLTVPLARYVSEYYNQLTFPFKRYQVGKVFRGERAQRGRYREFYQCDVDIISPSLELVNDAQIVNMMYRVINFLNIGEFIICINNRKILEGFLQYLEAGKYYPEILRLIDKKLGKDALIEELKQYVASPERILKLLDIQTDDILKNLSSLNITNIVFLEGINELEKLMYYLELLDVPMKNLKIDLSIARGLDYYTGAVFETLLIDNPAIGSICSGGRYDNLTSLFCDKKLSGVGMSIGLTRLFSQLKVAGKLNFNGKKSLAKVLLFCDNKGNEVEFFKIYNALQAKGITTEISLDGGLKEKLSYANKLGIPFFVFSSNCSFVLKDMRIKSQTNNLSAEGIISLLGERNG